ncbi:hypothetical protein CTZ27_24980 [Streptomyces griseocarneus]|nr:hypothetical protein CTZ27_24980 [Streptomyces griseocarneus]
MTLQPQQPALAAELLQHLDLGNRARGARTGGYLRTLDLDEVRAADNANSQWFRNVLDALKRWPGHALVGDRAGRAAWLIAQRAEHDRALQERCLALLTPAAAAKTADPRHLAFLTDHYMVTGGLAQLFGTQYGPEGILPVHDPDHLNDRRLAHGLCPLPLYALPEQPRPHLLAGTL